MNRELFTTRKATLINAARNQLAQETISEENRKSLTEALKIISEYNFENRLQIKGLLSHTIMDSLKLDYTLASLFIRFDESIS